jgi:hypothetical protein
VEVRDLSAQFYLTEEDVGQNRAEACKEKLQELNNAVEVSASSAQLTPDYLEQFQVRVLLLQAHSSCLNLLQTTGHLVGRHSTAAASCIDTQQLRVCMLAGGGPDRCQSGGEPAHQRGVPFPPATHPLHQG